MKLREWQAKAFPLWWAKKRGIVKVVTGGGKTVFAIHCLAKYLEENKDHSIFIAFAPKDKPKIALAVYVENGGWGSTWAAPIAGLMIQKYTNSKINLELEKFIINGNTVNIK